MLIVSLLVAATSANASELTVTHPTAPNPTYIDFEPKQVDSPGDVRIFHFTGETQDGNKVVMEWIMTTTGLDTIPGADSRVTLGVFSFSNHDQDQILIQGVGLYPSKDSTFKPSSSLTRAIIGGTGKYAGASGTVLSTHRADGSWVHEFHLSE